MPIATTAGTGSGVSTRNPLYDEFTVDWKQMRDTYRGERTVKEQGFEYLPATSGMIEDGITATKQEGWKAYAAYRRRARFPDFVRESVEAMLGVMHHKPPVIELPPRMEPLLEKATLRNESLAMLLRRVNEEQLTMGRCGLLLEVPEIVAALDGTPKQELLPLIAMYHAESPVNWDEGERDGVEVDTLNLVVIDETEMERKEFSWERVEKYRVLVLGDSLASGDSEVVGPRVYGVSVVRHDEKFDQATVLTPMLAGQTIDFIPFVFVNTKDVTPTPDDPPLLGLSNLALTVYRGEADYRQALFMQGQDTLVTIGATGAGADGARRTGAGASIDLPQGGDAKYIGVDSGGLPEMRMALENDYDRGTAKASALLESVGSGAESGAALRVRVAARTASLNQVALTGAFALEQSLKMAARWLGLNEEEVKVMPNLDFVADIMPAAELTGLMAAKGLGAPLSLASIHAHEQDRGLTEMTFEEEIEAMTEEAEAGLPGATAPGMGDDEGSTNPNGPDNEDDLDDDENAEEEGGDGDQNTDDDQGDDES